MVSEEGTYHDAWWFSNQTQFSASKRARLKVWERALDDVRKRQNVFTLHFQLAHQKACFVVPRLVAGQVKARACNALCGEMIKETYILVTKGRAESRVLMDGTVDLMKNFPSKRGNCPMTNDPTLPAYRNIYSSRKRNCEREYFQR